MLAQAQLFRAELAVVVALAALALAALTGALMVAQALRWD